MSEKTMQELLQELDARDRRTEEGGGRARMSRHRKLGRMTARERITALVDAGSFLELGRDVLHRHSASSDALAANRHPGDGLVCGFGSVDGRTVAVYANDPTVLRGALGHAASQKLCRLLDLALERRTPVLALIDSDGARVGEGVFAVEAYGEVIHRTIRLKNVVPQLTLALGICVGGAAYTAALTDCVGMVQGQSYMFITGPKVTKVVTGEEPELDALGGPALHAKVTGACHAVLPDEHAGIGWLKRVLSAITVTRVEPVDPWDRETPEIETLVPASARRGYDMRKVLASIFDRESVLELSPTFAPNLLTAFARLDGRTVAVVASQPMQLAGTLNADASRKGAAFVSWAGRLGVPIVTLVDVPGYMPGVREEVAGTIPHGATLLTAYANARVPRICLVLRKSYGAGSVLSFSSQLRFALPLARVAPMGAEASVEVILGPTPEDPEGREVHAARKAAWLAENDSAWSPAESGYIDRVIRPAEARSTLSLGLRHLGAAAELERR